MFLLHREGGRRPYSMVWVNRDAEFLTVIDARVQDGSCFLATGEVAGVLAIVFAPSSLTVGDRLDFSTVSPLHIAAARSIATAPTTVTPQPFS